MKILIKFKKKIINLNNSLEIFKINKKNYKI